MIAYFAVILAILFLGLIIKLFKLKNGKKIFLIVSFFILFLFNALRSETIGTDLIRYKENFLYNDNYKINELFQFGHFEYGYTIYSRLIYNITNGNFRLFLVITSFISLLGVYKFIKENSNNYLLSVILYFCLGYYIFTFSGLRQSIALSIILLSIKYIREKKIFKFVLTVIIASSFHITAFIFLPAYFISNIEIEKNYFVIYILALIFIYLIRYRIVGYFTISLYTDYLSLDNQGSGYTILITYCIILIFFTLYKKLLLSKNSDNNMWYNFVCIGTLIQILATVESSIHRATFYYLISLIIIIPYIVEMLKNKKTLAYIIIIILSFAYFAYTVPYKFYEIF